MQTDGEISYKSTRVSPGLLAKVYGLTINVKPNPACEWAASDYTLPDDVSSAEPKLTNRMGITVEICTINGQKGQNLIDTRKLPPGTYIYSLTT